MSRSFIAPFALALTLLGAAHAQAADVRIIGHADGFETVDAVLSVPNATLSISTEAGGFTTTVNGESFVTYCIDLYEWTSFGVLYTDYTLVPNATHAYANARANTDIAKLFATAGALTGSVAQAALQIAIWEIGYEATGPYSLAAGAAQFTGGTAATSGALSLASTWLAAVPGQTRSADLAVLESSAANGIAGHQDLVTPVPEPSTYALLAAGLFGVGFMARRRARQAA